MGLGGHFGPKVVTDEVFGLIMDGCADCDQTLSDKLLELCKVWFAAQEQTQSSSVSYNLATRAARGHFSLGPRAGAAKLGQGVALA